MTSVSKRFCSVPQCSTYCSEEVSMHYFPLKDKKLCEKWKTVLKIGKEISKYMNVCSKHFLETDFMPITTHTQRKRLKKGVVPSQNLPVRFHDRKKPPERSKRLSNYYYPKRLKLRNHVVPTMNLPQDYKQGKNPRFYCSVNCCFNTQLTKKLYWLNPPHYSELATSTPKKWHLWMKILGFEELFAKRLTVCEDHFIKGAPSEDPNDPDYVPSVNVPQTKSKVEELTLPEVKDPLSLEDLKEELEEDRTVPLPEFVTVDEAQYVKEEPMEYEDVLEECIKVEPVDLDYVEVKVEPGVLSDDHTYCKN